MKAAIYENYGPPEVVQISEVEKPVPKENEVLIKVYASTVNRTDCGFRSAEYFISRFFSGLLAPKNQILGCEFAGEVETIGTSVTAFKIGDKVFGFNDTKFGGHAEYMTIAENDAIATMPHNTNYEDAAAITEGAHYALCDIRAAKIASGQQILINGATGAIGSAAVQLVKYFGAEVTAVCDTKNVELVKSLGADEVIDYLKQDFTQLNKKFDVVFDAVGKSSFRKCKPLLKKQGIYMSTELGPRWENPFLALSTPLLSGKKVLFPLPTISKADVLFLKELVATGKFKPVRDRKYPLAQIVDAYRFVETGMKTGNVIIVVRDN
ncbi:MAG: NAD(P)-dependent alcohol dehydrogenase [Chitinophagales bacterium]|nr:NAD(P)-dependent alcohol dehydrogenase [Chitinophagales bacterium]